MQTKTKDLQSDCCDKLSQIMDKRGTEALIMSVYANRNLQKKYDTLHM